MELLVGVSLLLDILYKTIYEFIFIVYTKNPKKYLLLTQGRNNLAHDSPSPSSDP